MKAPSVPRFFTTLSVATQEALPTDYIIRVLTPTKQHLFILTEHPHMYVNAEVIKTSSNN